MARKTRSSKNTELIVRELGTGVVNATTIAPNATEVQDNLASFFNDTPYDLDLVAFRLGVILGYKAPTGDTASEITAFGVAELSRQAIAGQQEGIMGNQRAIVVHASHLNAGGGFGGSMAQKGEMLFGDFKTPLMTLEVQQNLFLHGVITNLITSSVSLNPGDVNLELGVTLYFKVRRTGY